jgi:hypothetical protein
LWYQLHGITIIIAESRMGRGYAENTTPGIAFAQSGIFHGTGALSTL